MKQIHQRETNEHDINLKQKFKNLESDLISQHQDQIKSLKSKHLQELA